MNNIKINPFAWIQEQDTRPLMMSPGSGKLGPALHTHYALLKLTKAGICNRGCGLTQAQDSEGLHPKVTETP